MILINCEWNSCKAHINTWLADDASQITADFDPKSAPGSTILVIATGDIYMKNCAGKWQKFGTSEVI